jgi:hypothetical protein
MPSGEDNFLVIRERLLKSASDARPFFEKALLKVIRAMTVAGPIKANTPELLFDLLMARPESHFPREGVYETPLPYVFGVCDNTNTMSGVFTAKLRVNLCNVNWALTADKDAATGKPLYVKQAFGDCSCVVSVVDMVCERRIEFIQHVPLCMRSVHATLRQFVDDFNDVKNAPERVYIEVDQMCKI